jgi:Uma2 family endonuclease
VLIPSGNVRRPDVGVDCGPFVGRDRHAAEPRVVFEVLSPSTRAENTGPKLADYQSVSSIEAIVHIEPERTLLRAFVRGRAGSWPSHPLSDRDASLTLGVLGIELPLADVYEDVSIPTDIPPE